MKRIQRGVTYNTETSIKVGDSTCPIRDRTGSREIGKVRETLYQTRGGVFFLVAEETKPVWNQRAQESQEQTETEFTPMSRDEAQEWVVEGNIEVFDNPFEDPPEAVAEDTPGETIYVRMPAALKRRIERCAADSKTSVNVWAMRAMERSMERPSTREAKELAIAWWIAYTGAHQEDQEWSEEKHVEALEEIAQLIQNFAEEKYGERLTTDEFSSELINEGYRDQFAPNSY